MRNGTLTRKAGEGFCLSPTAAVRARAGQPSWGDFKTPRTDRSFSWVCSAPRSVAVGLRGPSATARQVSRAVLDEICRECRHGAGGSGHRGDQGFADREPGRHVVSRSDADGARHAMTRASSTVDEAHVTSVASSARHLRETPAGWRKTRRANRAGLRV